MTSALIGAALGHVSAAELRDGVELVFGDAPVVIVELRRAAQTAGA